MAPVPLRIGLAARHGAPRVRHLGPVVGVTLPGLAARRELTR